MAKRDAKAKSPTWWISQLDPNDMQGAHEEATTDAYGDYEQHTGFMTLLEEDLVFPFNVKFMGKLARSSAWRGRKTVNSDWIF